MLTTRTRALPGRRSPVAAPSVPAVGAAAAMALLAASHTFVDIVSSSIGALLPTLKDRFDLSSTGAGVIVASVAVSTSMSQPLMGRVADRVGARRVAGTGAVLSAALLSLVGVAPSLWLVFALIVVGGLGSAGYHPAAAVLARRVLPERAQLGVSLLAAGGLLGFAIGPVVALLLVAHAGIGFTPLLMVPGVLFGAVMWRFLPGEPVTARADRPTPSLTLLRGPVGHLALAAGLAALAGTTFAAGIPMWLTESGGFADDTALIGVSLALYELGAAAGGLAIGWAVTRIAPARIAFATLLAAAPVLLVALVVEPGGGAFLVLSVVAGVLLNAATPVLVVAAQERAPQAVAAASGIVMGLAGGSAGLAFVGVGALADTVGLRFGLTVGFLTVVPAAVLARRALVGRPSSAEPQLLIGAVCACLAGSRVVTAHRCSERCACA